MRALGILGMCYIIVTPLTQRDFLKWGCQTVSPWGELKGVKAIYILVCYRTQQDSLQERSQAKAQGQQ